METTQNRNRQKRQQKNRDIKEKRANAFAHHPKAVQERNEVVKQISALFHRAAHKKSFHQFNQVMRGWTKLRQTLDKYNQFLYLEGDGIVNSIADLKEDIKEKTNENRA